eukprot:4892907-Amphidinium_carterae.1
MSPPTSTTSRSRTKNSQLQDDLPPLCIASHPRGVPHLSAAHQSQVHQANVTFDLFSDIFLACDTACMAAALENPRRSLLWRLPTWRRVQSVL